MKKMLKKKCLPDVLNFWTNLAGMGKKQYL